MKHRVTKRGIALVLVLTAACALLYPGTLRASAMVSEVRFRVGSTACAVGYQNGPVMLVRMDVAPYLRSGRVLIPVRFLAQAVGVRDEDVVWEEENQTVTLKKGEAVVSFTVGNPVMEKRVGPAAPELVAMDLAPEITNDRVCLPARWAAEGFGCQVRWEPSEMTVIIRSKSGGESE
ncbi:stalk domain-containing protein [Desulfothermobacter acidiphilus]|uniref:stalk domain-containing protein n=1 Tax=Desulfothermobacter acidiphilus TaxID=1938353 RepID=UPI003F8A0864